MNQEVRQYINRFSLEDQSVINELRKTILDHLPKGFEETLSYGMIGYVVPHSIYPQGYHVDPTLPLGLMAIARQKNAFSLYHMGLYADKDLFDWFKSNYEAHYGRLDHGKSCLRFKSKEKIPFDLIGILVEKISVQQWINIYESTLKR
jgi:uncharacterized protein YdhG (YjbR/CyaY superfamily)